MATPPGLLDFPSRRTRSSPVMSDHFLAFLGISILVIATPGPDTALTIRNTLLGGRRGGVLTALGVAAGQAIWALATSVGIVALLVASEPVFVAVKLAGAAYLVILGAQALFQALRPGAGPAATAGGVARRRLASPLAFRQGVDQRSRQPEDGGVLHQPAAAIRAGGRRDLRRPVRARSRLLLLTFTWLALYAGAVARAGDVLRPAAHPPRRRGRHRRRAGRARPAHRRRAPIAEHR